MRFASCFAVVLLLGWQVAAMGQAGPPPPQSFGPDTIRTGVFTGEGTTEPGLSCDASPSGGRVCSGFLRSEVDRTLLDVSLMIPPGTGPHPMVVVMHGWGGSKESLGYIADPLLADGHAVQRYSTRGFGRSWGQVNLSDMQVELADLRSMIGAPRVQLNVRLIDVAPDGKRELVTRGTFMLEPARATTNVVIPTYGNVWEAAPDHTLQLHITTVDTPYLAPSRIPSVTEISQVRLEVPMR
jgi:hypothetical protein